MVVATLAGPMRLTSAAASRAASKLTVAAAWIPARQPARRSRPASSSPSPSTPTSPATAISLEPTTWSNSAPSSSRRRSKQSLLRMSRLARSWAPRRPGRTITRTSQPGTERMSRSTTAAPRNPVAPVTPIRVPASASRITRPLYHVMAAGHGQLGSRPGMGLVSGPPPGGPRVGTVGRPGSWGGGRQAGQLDEGLVVVDPPSGEVAPGLVAVGPQWHLLGSEAVVDLVVLLPGDADGV